MSDLKDLEDLLEELGESKPVAPSKKTRSSVVNLSELEALMSDLADSPAPPPPSSHHAHISKPASAPPPQRSNVVSASFERAPVAAKPAQPRSTVVSTSFEADDLDSIMDALNGESGGGGHHGGFSAHIEVGGGHHGGHDHHDHHHEHHNGNHHDDHHNNHHSDHHNDHHHGNGHGHHGHIQQDFDFDDLDIELPPPAPKHVAAPVQTPHKQHAPALSRDTTNTIDELEDLLNGLDDTSISSRASVRASISAKPPTSAATSRLSVSARPPATHTPPAHTPSPHIANGSGTFGVNARASVSAPSTHHVSPSANIHAHAPAHSSNMNSVLSFGAGVGGGGGGHHAPANQHSNLSFGVNVHAGGGAPHRPSPSSSSSFNQHSHSTPPNQHNKPFVANPHAPKPINNSNALDALLGDLQSQLHAVPDPSAPASNGTCASCGRGILGEVITASGNRFHPECFVCGNCRNPLGTSNFYEQDGVAHCETCYQELLCPRCGHCDEPILDRCVTAMGKKWHLDHFICTQCLNPFKNGSFYERDGRAFCEGCFATAFAPRCAGCNQPVSGPCINAVGQAWHPEHFVCQYCHKAFSGSFYEFGGKPYCELHYHQQTGSLCAGCSKAIAGKCVDALGKKWHPEHFICAFCMNMLAAGSFTENSGKAYCKECHGKLFG